MGVLKPCFVSVGLKNDSSLLGNVVGDNYNAVMAWNLMGLIVRFLKGNVVQWNKYFVFRMIRFRSLDEDLTY